MTVLQWPLGYVCFQTYCNVQSPRRNSFPWTCYMDLLSLLKMACAIARLKVLLHIMPYTGHVQRREPCYLRFAGASKEVADGLHESDPILFEVNETPSLDPSFSSPLSAPYANHSLFCVSLQQNQHVPPKHIPLWNLIANLSEFLVFSFSDEAWLESRLVLSKAGGKK